MITAHKKGALLGVLGLSLLGCANVPIPGVSNLSVTAQADGAHLSWSDVSAPDVELRVERRSGDARFQLIANLPGTAVEYVDTMVPSGVRCAYRVVTFTEGTIWNGTYSSEVSLPR